MKKFKCKDCAHVFEGDLSTTRCPNCESENIDFAKKSFSWNLILIGLVLVAAVFLFRSCPKKGLEVNIKQSKAVNCIDLSVKNFKSDYAMKLNVKIERDNSFFTNVTLKDEVTQIELPSGCYTFFVSFLDGRKNPKIKQCMDTICFGVTDSIVPPTITKVEERVPPLIKDISQNQNCETKKWDIAVIAKSVDMPLQYSANNGKSFSAKNQFHLPKGVFDIVVKDSKGLTSSRQIVLGKIECAEKITSAMIQSWLDRLAKGDPNAQAEFDKLFMPKATAAGLNNTNTAYQLMIEVITTNRSVKLKSLEFATVNKAVKVSRIVVQ